MNPLTDLIPPRFRKYLYAALFVVGVVSTAYHAGDGDWGTALGSLFAALIGANAHANVHPSG